MHFLDWATSVSADHVDGQALTFIFLLPNLKGQFSVHWCSLGSEMDTPPFFFFSSLGEKLGEPEHLKNASVV